MALSSTLRENTVNLQWDVHDVPMSRIAIFAVSHECHTPVVLGQIHPLVTTDLTQCSKHQYVVVTQSAAKHTVISENFCTVVVWMIYITNYIRKIISGENLLRSPSSGNFSLPPSLCILCVFTRGARDFTNQPITSKYSDHDIGNLTWTFFAYFKFVFAEF